MIHGRRSSIKAFFAHWDDEHKVTHRTSCVSIQFQKPMKCKHMELCHTKTGLQSSKKLTARELRINFPYNSETILPIIKTLRVPPGVKDHDQTFKILPRPVLAWHGSCLLSYK